MNTLVIELEKFKGTEKAGKVMLWDTKIFTYENKEYSKVKLQFDSLEELENLGIFPEKIKKVIINYSRFIFNWWGNLLTEEIEDNWKRKI